MTMDFLIQIHAMTDSAICAKCRAVFTEQAKLSGHHRKYHSGTQVKFRGRLKTFFEWLKMNAKRLLVGWNVTGTTDRVSTA